MFTWNKAGTGALFTPIANWVGGLAADKAAALALAYVGPMPDDVHGAIYLGVSAGIVGAVVYLTPNASQPPAAPAESAKP